MFVLALGVKSGFHLIVMGMSSSSSQFQEQIVGQNSCVSLLAFNFLLFAFLFLSTLLTW